MRSTCLDWGWRPPVDFDYTWTSLGRFALAAVDELGLDRFHLVVHDIGGPVGVEVAAAVPERVKSLTVLNSPVEVDRFRRPWVWSRSLIAASDELTCGCPTSPCFGG